jgi:hypothetical protein
MGGGAVSAPFTTAWVLRLAAREAPYVSSGTSRPMTLALLEAKGLAG